ncbi:hypothetical protein EVAR_36108_1 [Eumeta japonica]|uniref:Uncharacterized protein n=1 Tax=Eumeta variegata TaxID=151549 RepID=A0A4C1X142_EUMVA|nr:hypothetical protein EVAR_36108_1 [Eumeta japonica]
MDRALRGCPIAYQLCGALVRLLGRVRHTSPVTRLRELIDGSRDKKRNDRNARVWDIAQTVEGEFSSTKVLEPQHTDCSVIAT